MTPDQICAKYTFSDFFRFATPEEKEMVFRAVAREANEEQRRVVDLSDKTNEHDN